MKRRTVQILLALFLIIYRKTWFWWIFNHFSARFVTASREFFQILAFLEFSVTFLAILYLLVFEGRKILELKWKWRYPVYLLLAYGVSYLSDIALSFLTRVTLSFTYCLSARTNYRRNGLPRSSDEYIFERFTLVWRCFTISLCLWLCACQFRFNTTCLFHLCKWRSDCSIPLPKNSFSLLSYFAPYHD